MNGGYSAKNLGVKRIMQEAKEIATENAYEYSAHPLEDNLFEWHFTIRGPDGTDFEGGRYHGRILLPSEYPFKPPEIMFLTPNGRFELYKKICLSITGFHPEFWQPAWGIRTILLAVIAFFPTEAKGAIGGLDYTQAERRQLARR
ncbi:UBC-like protein [Rhizopus microsporus ATCC 52813]|uniref:UBC-like protein n=2 Tax=Rhizopus microsporus TaxID=58291 RepID=A0A2G4SJB7_RHIZD|nr:UBC-like protein [Rhizopus microsporus ATCC 52813]PHZ08864.1 UBC-like protein [Rhizopus microsporus ATCC 52813]